MVGAIRDSANLQELTSAKACGACRSCTFPSDAQSSCRRPEFKCSRLVDDVLIAARDCAEQHVELLADLAGSEAELGEETWISLIGREGPAYEPKLVVVLDRGRADNNITEREAAAEAASRSRADHDLKHPAPLDQVLSPNCQLGLAMSAHCEQHAEFLEEMALKPPHRQYPRPVARRNKRAEQGLELVGVRHGYESLCEIHRSANSSALELPSLEQREIDRVSHRAIAEVARVQVV